MRYALLFSGQGAQHPEMLAWLERDEILDDLAARIGSDWRERLADPAWAGDNRRAQLLLTATALAAWRQLAGELPPPAIVAGYSVGELAAFSAAGVFEAAAALDLAEARARCMDAAAAAGEPTGLIGLSGATPAALPAFCGRFDLDIAIRIDAGTAVLGGLRARLTEAAAAATAAGWHCTPLNVALASHTRWMQPALEPFAEALASTPLRGPARRLQSNALGRVNDAAAARAALVQQLVHTVRWDECLEAVAAQGVAAVLEIGPGSALARLWQERHPAIPARSADEFRSAAGVTAWLRRHAGSG